MSLSSTSLISLMLACVLKSVQTWREMNVHCHINYLVSFGMLGWNGKLKRSVVSNLTWFYEILHIKKGSGLSELFLCAPRTSCVLMKRFSFCKKDMGSIMRKLSFRYVLPAKTDQSVHQHSAISPYWLHKVFFIAPILSKHHKVEILVGCSNG